jgi:sugar lactone lactonase YvrE
MKTVRTQTSLVAFVIAGFLQFSPTLNAEPILYATTGAGSQLVRIDVGAGTVSKVGDLGEPFALAVALSPSGRLFTVTHSFPGVPGTPQLASVNRTQGTSRPFGPNLGAEIFMGLGFSPDGALYGVNSMSFTPNTGSLYQFDPATGAATKVGVTGGCFEIMDIAFHPDGTMYGAAWDSLYRIDRATGQATLVKTFDNLTAVMGLAIDDEGNFYVSEIVDNAPLWHVNPNTGATTQVPGVSLSFPHGLEFIPTPFSRPTSRGEH